MTSVDTNFTHPGVSHDTGPTRQEDARPPTASASAANETKRSRARRRARLRALRRLTLHGSVRELTVRAATRRR